MYFIFACKDALGKHIRKRFFCFVEKKKFAYLELLTAAMMICAKSRGNVRVGSFVSN